MPTVTIGENTGNTYTGVQDLRMRSALPDDHSSTSTSIECSGTTSTSLLKFTGLSNITGPVTVSAATLYVNIADNGGVTTQILAARRVLQAANYTQATWNSYSTGNAWNTGGCRGDGTDRTATAAGSQNPIGATGTKAISLDTSLVEGWINGTITNNGLQLQDDAGGTGYMLIVSSEGADLSRPYLEVTYTAGSGGSTGRGRLVGGKLVGGNLVARL